jgi:hypothetical protein
MGTTSSHCGWDGAACSACGSGTQCLVTCVSQATPVGGACGSSSDCNGFECDTSLAGGYCTATCTTDADCGDGAACIADGQANQCYALCTAPGTQSSCRSSYTCTALNGTAGVSLPFGVCMGQ